MPKAEVDARIELIIGKRKGPRYVSKRQKKKDQARSK